MPIQIYKANPVNDEIYLRSETIPVSNMVNTRSSQSFMAWLNAPTSVWNTAGQITSIVGTYDGNHDANPLPTTALQIGTQQDNNVAPNTGNSGNGVMICTWGGIVLVSTSLTGLGVITPFNPPADTWFHVAYTCNTWNGTNQTHNLYINGILYAQSINARQGGGNPTHFYLNGFPQVPPVTYSETGDVQIDNIRFYNRQLSGDEILTIYNSHGSTDAITTGLVAYFIFEEGVPGQAVSKIIDVSGNLNNLQIVNNGAGAIIYTALGVTGSNLRTPHN